MPILPSILPERLILTLKLRSQIPISYASCALKYLLVVRWINIQGNCLPIGIIVDQNVR